MFIWIFLQFLFDLFYLYLSEMSLHTSNYAPSLSLSLSLSPPLSLTQYIWLWILTHALTGS